MSDLVGAAQLGNSIVIRYDGLDADRHVVEIGDLSVSLRGLGRIITVAGTFAAQQRLMERSSARPVRVLVGPPRDGSLTVEAAMMWLDQHAFAASTVSGLTVLLIGYVFKSAAGQREEMKHLRASLETAIKELGHRDQPVVERLLDTIDRMADILKPAARQAVAPIGRSAGTLEIGEQGAHGGGITLGKVERDAIDASEPIEIGAEVSIGVRFSEMNWDARTCKVELVSEPELRYPAEITDPEVLVPNNAYADAFAGQTVLEVRAKPTMRNGVIERWYISNHS
ncbi:hypothetical protein N6H05_14840 [Sphingobium sp. WTD-1]|uniref:DUF7946 domain-containing protein n=1 Tax=Sphingobium sp. WTD-1 TaxID=2979467 RepID=UPI0024DEEDC0|nr:hypothetical protein [Sphingobium sp. WTD-1]WIA54341.1 hypothetical protein N6H05_14840 [Sphingobium sp. WTD-1]